MTKEKEAAAILKAHFLQKRNGDWIACKDAYLQAKACDLGTCGNLDDVPEEEKRAEIKKREDDFIKLERKVLHDTIVIFKLQELLEE